MGRQKIINIGERITELVSPKQLAKRWSCSRSSVDRVARRAGLSRICLGTGVNGMVRYVRAEVEAFEQSRTVAAMTE